MKLEKSRNFTRGLVNAMITYSTVHGKWKELQIFLFRVRNKYFLPRDRKLSNKSRMDIQHIAVLCLHVFLSLIDHAIN